MPSEFVLSYWVEFLMFGVIWL